MSGRRASLLGELALLPDSATREYQVTNSLLIRLIQIKKVKLPRLMSHPAFACGIIYGQSAMKQLQNQSQELLHLFEAAGSGAKVLCVPMDYAKKDHLVMFCN